MLGLDRPNGHCHPERSEGPFLLPQRSLAALGMTVPSIKELPMPRLGFGAFLAPHHPIGENPTLQFRRDLKFVEHLDELGYDEFWGGEHHSSGWEMIPSPHGFLPAAGGPTNRIKPGPAGIPPPHPH